MAAAIRDREARAAHLKQELVALDGRERVSHVELHRIERIAREKADGRREVLKKRTPQTRQILSKMLRERLVFVPETRNGKPGYRFHGEGSVLKLLSGLVPELSRVLPER